MATFADNILTWKNPHLTIIELTMWLAVCVCATVWQSTPRTADVTVTKIAGYIRVLILMNRWFFRIFGIHTFYACGSLMQQRWLRGRIGLCTHGVTTMLGVSLQARRDITQVMLGVSLHARWDTTLVSTIEWCNETILTHQIWLVMLSMDHDKNVTINKHP